MAFLVFRQERTVTRQAIRSTPQPSLLLLFLPSTDVTSLPRGEEEEVWRKARSHGERRDFGDDEQVESFL